MLKEEKEQLLPIFPSNSYSKSSKTVFFFPLNNDSCLILKLFSFQTKKKKTVLFHPYYS